MADDNDQQHTNDDRDEQQEPRREQQRDTEDRRDEGDLGDAGKRALQEERRRARDAKNQAKTAEDRAAAAEARLAELERAQMNDQQRVEAERDDWRKKFEDAQTALAARELDVLRRDVAAEKGLPAGMARRLNGTTREELENDADELAQLVAKPDTPPVSRTPKPDPSQGVTSSGTRASTVASVMEKYMAGRGNTTTT